jgi:hypothetical protein
MYQYWDEYTRGPEVYNPERLYYQLIDATGIADHEVGIECRIGDQFEGQCYFHCILGVFLVQRDIPNPNCTRQVASSGTGIIPAHATEQEITEKVRRCLDEIAQKI